MVTKKPKIFYHVCLIFQTQSGRLLRTLDALHPLSGADLHRHGGGERSCDDPRGVRNAVPCRGRRGGFRCDGRPLGEYAENFAVRRLRSGGEKAQPKGGGTFRCLLDARCGCVSRLELHDRRLEEHMDRLAGRGRAVRGGAESLPSVHEKPRRVSRRGFYGGGRAEMD